MIKIAIMGCGRVAQHYRYIFQTQKLTGYIIVGVADLVFNKAESLGLDFNCPYYDNVDEMILKSKPDLLLVLTPSGGHYQHALNGILKGINVLVEKPITMIPSQGVDILKIARERRLLYGAVFQNRFNPAVLALKEAIDLGRFGKIVTATIRLRWCRYQEYYEDEWHGTWRDDGGVINQQAIHHLDALNWLAGPIHSVCAVAKNRINVLEAEDTMTAVIEFKSGAIGTIEATTAARPIDIEASLSITGELGAATIGGVALNKIEAWNFVNKHPDDSVIPARSSIDVPNGYGLGHAQLLQEVIDTISRNEITPPILAEESIETTKLVHALYASVETRSWTNVNDVRSSIRLGV